MKALRASFVLSGLAVLVLAAGPALAHYMGQPKVMDTGNEKIITNPHGTPLYTYGEDPLGASTCTGKCAKVWPPELATEDAQPHGRFTILRRADGSRQWAYGGKPLYGYRYDDRGGEPTGDGIGGFHVATVGTPGRK